MVTHDPRLAAFADKIIHILDGKIQNVEIVEHPFRRGTFLNTNGNSTFSNAVIEPIKL